MCRLCAFHSLFFLLLPCLDVAILFLNIFKKILFIYFWESGREKEREREREKHQCLVASQMSPTGDLACNPGTCPDWEWNQRPFGSQAGTQSTEPHQPGLCFSSIVKKNTKETHFWSLMFFIPVYTCYRYLCASLLLCNTGSSVRTGPSYSTMWPP